jgi:LysR family glycine cleavage system transcriptional activator
MRSRDKHPPLPTLRVFETVGRLLSFRKASEELCISQSAVSYHVKNLEDELGTRLFSRHARGIAFTPAGERYWAAVREAFGTIEQATADIKSPSGEQAVKLSVLPSFASGWLVHRLRAFTQAWPGIRVSINPTLELSDLERGDADLAIRYGMGDWPETKCTRLLPERLMPVCSPKLLASGPAIRSASDVLAHTLLYVSRPYEWDLWANASKVDLAKASKLHLTEYSLVMQAAADGLGVAMGRQLLVADWLRRGALCSPLPEPVSPPALGYWVCHRRRGLSRDVATLVDWLKVAARQTAP